MSLKSDELVNALDLNKKVKEKNKIFIKELTSTDDINTREYIPSNQK